jgi:hypothetical protein
MEAIATMPDILTANTYFWHPSGSASGRRYNENKRVSEVREFFASLGFVVTDSSDGIKAASGEIEAYFSYSESCKNVYKRFEVYRNGKRSNITAIRKLIA